MNEEKALKELKRCKVEFSPGSNRSWSIRLNEIDSNCLEALNSISSKMGPESRKFMKKRLVAGSPEIEKTLKELELK
jgi:hypothetical protein